MPYADPDKRREFHRRYKRKWRALRAKISPLEGFKVYVCPRFPGLGVGLAQFVGGFLITNRPDVQAQVERHPEFGKFIFPLLMDLALAPTETEDEDD